MKYEYLKLYDPTEDALNEHGANDYHVIGMIELSDDIGLVVIMQREITLVPLRKAETVAQGLRDELAMLDKNLRRLHSETYSADKDEVEAATLSRMDRIKSELKRREKTESENL